MSNKVFVFLVVVLTILIIISSVFLVMSMKKYQGVAYPQGEKPSVLTDTPNEQTSKDLEEKDRTNETDEKTESEIAQTEPVREENTPKNDTSNTSISAKYILPSDTKEITSQDLVGMDYETLNRAYNEIFARHGHDFKTASLKEYFDSQSWYKPIANKSVGTTELSELENKNLNTIRARIDELKNN